MIYGSCGREGVGTKLYREPELTLGGPGLVPPRKCLLEAKVASVDVTLPGRTPYKASACKILASTKSWRRGRVIALRSSTHFTLAYALFVQSSRRSHQRQRREAARPAATDKIAATSS